MWDMLNKDHHKITGQAVTNLKQKYPRLNIYEQGSIDGAYFIIVAFPSGLQPDILIFNATSADDIEQQVVSKIDLLVASANKILSSIVADAGLYFE